MRRETMIALLLLVIAAFEATASESVLRARGAFHNTKLISGLHIALPETMTDFSDEIIPLP
jgi:hypothetical protein